ncbi:CAAX prenyl protease 2 isoform X2 [Nilaparvata lugens]|uniref:CAAX prenyl protease 2 isoform X1 n=2 Tax=Nilaparvata lugens TaxID=108931 RepID=UPI000B99BF6E|nr:CAAX prenyl protease 2 isoform X1 [Nilaparvata lugens]XP_039281539.1 CAAX prenyl protease 2 isoform X2 [Nilaparvata lugens]
MEDDVKHQYYFSCISSITACIILSVAYVASLYVWNTPHNRNHPSVIKKRFFSVFIVMLISPIFTYMFTRCNKFSTLTLWELLGFRWQGFLLATVLPLILTVTLFLGPLALQGFSGLWNLYAEPMFWVNNVQSLQWLRNYVVAPLSEEFTFRACMIPLLLQCLSPSKAIFICPLFFGIAHFHHMADRMKSGLNFQKALLISCFQFSYTTVFGAYSAYLFLRTGHFVAPFLAHAFCNHMGFPDFNELATLPEPNRTAVMALSVIGLLAFCLLLDPLTNPEWYHNHIFYTLPLDAS